MENFDELVAMVSKTFHSEVEDAFKALLGIAKCSYVDDRKQMQLQLVENGYDLVHCRFKDDPFKSFVYLTDLRNKFKVGFLVELNLGKMEVTRKRINSKQQYESIIRGKI